MTNHLDSQFNDNSFPFVDNSYDLSLTTIEPDDIVEAEKAASFLMREMYGNGEPELLNSSNLSIENCVEEPDSTILDSEDVESRSRKSSYSSGSSSSSSGSSGSSSSGSSSDDEDDSACNNKVYIFSQ